MPAANDVPRLLVVEDCPIVNRLLTELLTAEGYRVTAAADAASGLAAARRHHHDLAVLDLHLPDGSGIDLAGQLSPETPFLALTIDRTPAAIQACIAAGALGYLVKPLDAETFLRQVRVALERGREQRNLRRALRDHPTINKALGVLMGFLLLPERQAFARFAERAAARNTKAAALAAEILAAGETLGRAALEHRTNARAARAARAFLEQFQGEPR